MPGKIFALAVSDFASRKIAVSHRSAKEMGYVSVLCFYDIDKAEVKSYCHSASDKVESICISRNGKRLFSATAMSIQCWSVDGTELTGAEVLNYRRMNHPVLLLLDDWIVFGSQDSKNISLLKYADDCKLQYEIRLEVGNLSGLKKFRGEESLDEFVLWTESDVQIWKVDKGRALIWAVGERRN